MSAQSGDRLVRCTCLLMTQADVASGGVGPRSNIIAQPYGESIGVQLGARRHAGSKHLNEIDGRFCAAF